MRWINKFPLRLRSLFRKKRVERELSDELRFHLEKLIQENVGRGMTAEEARYAALRELGGVEQIKEQCRDMRRVNYIENFVQDVRYGLRMLAKNPGFTAVAVLTLALGIGANTAIFTVVNTVLLRPLPYPHSDRIVWVTQEIRTMHAEIAGGPDYLDWRDQNRSFERMAAYQEQGSVNLTGSARPERVSAAQVSASFFSTLGLEPIFGRSISEDEDRPGGQKVAVITSGFWRRYFASNPHVLGHTINLDGSPYTVVGVMPASFRFPGNSRIELLLPLALDAQRERLRMQMTIVRVIGLLKAGVTLAQARADLAAISGRNRPESGAVGPMPAASPSEATGAPAPSGPQMVIMAAPESGHEPAPRPPGTGGETEQIGGSGPVRMMPSIELKLIPLHDELVGSLRPALLILLGAVTLVLLIACANVANLLLARSSVRSREIAIRAALGAGRWRLFRQLLAESVLLGVCGGVLGLIFAFWGVGAVVALTPTSVVGDLFRLVKVGVDASVLGFALLTSVLTGIIFGLAPAVITTKPDLNESLKEGARASTVSLHRSRLRSALVVVELSLALVLFAGAGLLIKSFVRLLLVDPGFQPERVLTLAINLTESKYATGSQQAAFFKQLVERVQSLPGVQVAGLSDSLPFADYSVMITGLNPEGRVPQSPGTDPVVPVLSISPNYFRALGMRMLGGRPFSESDTAAAPKVAVVNETLARHFWPNQDPVGRRLTGGPNLLTVAGVVADTHHNGLAEKAEPELYLPFLQSPQSGMNLAIRTAADPTSIVNAVRAQVAASDPEQPVYDVTTMEQRLAESLSPRRFNMLLLSAFALLALVLAGVGIYGVMSYSVVQRTHEIGIRTALGARREDMLKLVVGQGFKLTLVGLGIGIAGALAMTRFLASLLYGVKPSDPLTFIAVSLILTATALLACYIPARRATKVDPMVALRYE